MGEIRKLMTSIVYDFEMTMVALIELGAC